MRRMARPFRCPFAVTVTFKVRGLWSYDPKAAGATTTSPGRGSSSSRTSSSASAIFAGRCRSPTVSPSARPAAAPPAEPAASSLVVTGSPVVPWMGMPRRVDVMKLPGWTRDERGDRRAGGLALDVGGLHAVRSGVEGALAPSFDPEVAVVDKLPLGPGGYPIEALLDVRARGPCRIVLG